MLTRFLLLCCWVSGLLAADWPITLASYVSGGSGAQSVRGAVIQADGTIVLAVNLGPTVVSAEQQVLGAANAQSGGALIRLRPDGQSVLAITRVAEAIYDLSTDAEQRLYVAAWDDGVLVIDGAVSTVLRHYQPGRVLRVDAADDGSCVALVTEGLSDPDESAHSGKLAVYAADGSHLGTFDGRNFTMDVAIDAGTRQVFSVGFRNASANDPNSGGSNPVQICYVRAMGYDGSPRWKAYDWSTSTKEQDYLNKPENNMADTRGYRCVMGADGKLYCGFETAGGNHLFRYDPFDIDIKSGAKAGGDKWHQLYNTQSQHKSIITKHEPSTGALLRYQEFCTRYGETGNTLRMSSGDLAIDALGNVYVAGTSAAGLPILPSQVWDGTDNRYAPKSGETAINRGGSTWTYTGGAFLMVMENNMSTRRMTLLAGRGDAHCVAVRRAGGALQQVVLGGSISATSFTKTTAKDYGFTTEAGVGPFVSTNPLPGTKDLGQTADDPEAFVLLIDTNAPLRTRQIRIRDTQQQRWQMVDGPAGTELSGTWQFQGLDPDLRVRLHVPVPNINN